MRLEIKRAILHVLIGAVIILASMETRIVWFLFFLLIAGLLISLLSLKYRLPLISWFLENFERPNYIKTFPGKGILFLVAGCLLSLKLFPNDIALASIAIVSLGDPVSHLISGNFKSNLVKRKNILGILAGIMISGIAASFFVALPFALIASAFAMAAEVLIIKLGEDPVDDNIIMPIVAGTVLYLLSVYV